MTQVTAGAGAIGDFGFFGYMDAALSVALGGDDAQVGSVDTTDFCDYELASIRSDFNFSVYGAFKLTLRSASLPPDTAFISITVEHELGSIVLLPGDATVETVGLPANTKQWVWSGAALEWLEDEVYAVTQVCNIVVEPCQELGRETRAYVSAYDRTKVHQSRLYRFERRCLVANFNGAIPPARTIVAATWRTDAPEIGVMSSPQISTNGRQTMVMFASQLGGWANLRVDATLDNTEIYTQVFRVNVREASFFFNDPPTQPGPFSVSVSA